MSDTPGVNTPDASYARSGDVAIAYQIVGTGPVDIAFVRGTTGDHLSTGSSPSLHADRYVATRTPAHVSFSDANSVVHNRVRI